MAKTLRTQHNHRLLRLTRPDFDCSASFSDFPKLISFGGRNSVPDGLLAPIPPAGVPLDHEAYYARPESLYTPDYRQHDRIAHL